MAAKRVYCLYRVSTIGQVEKDDIPMQRQDCREFAARQGWNIVKEFSEKGVSGFKVSAKDRDAIQEIQKDAVQGNFDILLVYMFDRLGRKEDETPFVVEWFVNNGIEVWSVHEGQQKFDTHVDKLLNYIRFWQASGESIKTSIRTKTRLAQIVQEGRFRGGGVPYGYRIVKKGRIGKKNRELYDLEINQEEAPVVQMIFDLYVNYGYGGRRIATILEDEGFLNRKGERFHYASIQNIIKNITYVGILRSGETRSEIFPDLQIISPELYARAEQIRLERTNNYMENRSTPLRNSGAALLSGNLYCGHCNGRMFSSSARKSHYSKPEDERVPIYKCYNRTQHKDLCDGPTSYRAERVDAVVSKIIHDVFDKAKRIKESDLLDAQCSIQIDECSAQLRLAMKEKARLTREQSKLDAAILASIEGSSPFTPEQLSRRLTAIENELDKKTQIVERLQEKLAQSNRLFDELRAEHRKLVSWAEVYDDIDPLAKKMIVSELVKAVRIYSLDEIEVEFSFSEPQYLAGLNM